jgi:membrane protein required for colicin V production
MEGLGLTAFDAVAIGVLLISAVMAFARGLIREVFSIVAFFAALFAALWGHRFLSPSLGMMGNELFATLAAGFLIFLIVFVAITILTSMVAKLAHSSGEIGALDRGAGMLFGAARGILIVALFVVLVRAVTGSPQTSPQAAPPNWLVNAKTYPFFERTAVVLEGLVPQVRQAIRERNAEKDAAKDGAAPAAAPAEPEKK